MSILTWAARQYLLMTFRIRHIGHPHGEAQFAMYWTDIEEFIIQCSRKLGVLAADEDELDADQDDEAREPDSAGVG